MSSLTIIYMLQTYIYTNIQTASGIMYITANITQSDVQVISYLRKKS